MKRLLPLLGAVLALALSSTAAADTFRVVAPHGSGGAGYAMFSPGGSVISFTQAQSGGPMSFAALRGIWQAAGNSYGIPWQVLAAINKVETGFGRNLGPSSAGGVGWMQFMPSTWARWGLDANGDGVADPNNPTDAIFSAARYLAACGGQTDIAAAVYCYNHSSRYVSDVLGLAALYGRGGGGGSGLFSTDQLQTQLDSASTVVSTTHTRLVAALAKVRKLARAERRYLRAATTARLLSDQLEARKHAGLLGVRRYTAEVAASRLRKSLHAATMRLGRIQDQTNAPSFLTGGPALLAGVDYSGVAAIAAQYLDVPYVWAGSSPSGFDCSGLVKYVFAQIGISLPHNTVAQWNFPGAVSVPQNQLQPGDLVFFNKLDHVGIYIGQGEFIDAPHTGAFVRIDSLSEPWYAAKYDGAKRVVGASFDSFTQSAGTTTFGSSVVYFTH